MLNTTGAHLNWPWYRLSKSLIYIWFRLARALCHALSSTLGRLCRKLYAQVIQLLLTQAMHAAKLLSMRVLQSVPLVLCCLHLETSHARDTQASP